MHCELVLSCLSACVCVQVYLCMCSYTDMQAEEPEDNPGCHLFIFFYFKSEAFAYQDFTKSAGMTGR